MQANTTMVILVYRETIWISSANVQASRSWLPTSGCVALFLPSWITIAYWYVTLVSCFICSFAHYQRWCRLITLCFEGGQNYLRSIMIALTIFEGLLFALALVKFIKHGRNNMSRAHFLVIFFRDGTVYFGMWVTLFPRVGILIDEWFYSVFCKHNFEESNYDWFRSDCLGCLLAIVSGFWLRINYQIAVYALTPVTYVQHRNQCCHYWSLLY